jgi:hypothetical protein
VESLATQTPILSILRTAGATGTCLVVVEPVIGRLLGPPEGRAAGRRRDSGAAPPHPRPCIWPKIAESLIVPVVLPLHVDTRERRHEDGGQQEEGLGPSGTLDDVSATRHSTLPVEASVIDGTTVRWQARLLTRHGEYPCCQQD